MSENQLTFQDAAALNQRRNVQTKSTIAQKVGKIYSARAFNNKCLRLAEDIFRLLVRDTETKVREVLADSLKHSQSLPRDVVDSILKDVDSVAVPFIQYYAELSDEDLIDIINIDNITRHHAVARRQGLSDNVSSHIVDKCADEVVEDLLTNESAQIEPPTFEKIIAKYPENEILKKGMIYRANLPFSVIEKILDKLSDKLKTYLVLNHNMPQDFTANLINEIKEKLTLKVSSEYSSDDRIKEFVRQLFNANRLTYSLITRAICSGDLKFFEYAVSFMSETPVVTVRKILFNSQADFEVRNLLRKALLPKSVFPAIFSALKVINDIRFDCCRTDSHLFTRKVIERILSYTPTTDELSDEDINYLISQIS